MRITIKQSSLLLLLSTGVLGAEPATITIDAGKAGPEINPRMYGVFLEEINTAVDGGLYAELIRNRGFEDAKAPEGFVLSTNPPKNNVQSEYPDGSTWQNPGGYATTYFFEVDKSLPYWSLVKDGAAQGSMSLDLGHPLNAATPRSCRLQINDATGRVGIANEGFWGIGVKEGGNYELSFWARSEGFSGELTATLETTEGKLASTAVKIGGLGREWKQYRATLKGTKTEPKARFVLAANTKGTVWLDVVSLFPQHTFKNRPNGLRKDIAEMIAGLKPGFVRFPGGCVVEGATVESAYNWKQTIGPIEQRQEIWNVWDYRRTHGMGLYEYLLFCEDLKAEPLYVSFAGQTCIYRNGTNLPMSEMKRVADNYLDALEYANGPKNSQWGKLRAESGHPDPFHMKLLEIGNENVGQKYEDQYSFIYPKIKAADSNVLALACFPQPRTHTDMADEHYYSSPQWFINNFHMYDNADRQSPPIYIAEVAVTSGEGGANKGNLIAALAEGVFLMGCERNGDHVRMVSYAPLLANVAGRTPLAGAPPAWHGMIYFDSSRVFGTVSYYLWKTLAENLPSRTLDTGVSFADEQGYKVSGQIGLGTWDASAEFKDVRVEKAGQVLYESDFAQGAKGWITEPREGGIGRWTVQDAAFRQSAVGRGMAFFGDKNWSDYTLTLKARKFNGSEGFLITVGRKGDDFYWWNLGGWGNTQHAIEHSSQGSQTMVGEGKPGAIENNRWYDIKVEVQGDLIRCYLDGQLINEGVVRPSPKLFAEAGRDDVTGDIVLKGINVSGKPVIGDLKLNGVAHIAPEATVTVLKSASLSDNNTLDQPMKVTATQSRIGSAGMQFTHEFPPYSLTVFRLKTR
jgi:alpha-L-arabinofuranosidase